MTSKLGYWATRGLAQPLRNLLVYVGEDFEDRRYVRGPGPEFNRDDWLGEKYTLGLPFPNIPYYIDDNVKMTQTNALFRYLGRKYNLDGETVKEKADCGMLLEIVMDLRNGFIDICYGPAEQFNVNRDTYVKNAKAKMSNLNDFLANKPFLIGSKVTVCDFHFYEMLDQHRIFEPTILDGLPKLREYCQRFEGLPRIKEHLASGVVKATPINNTSAVFIQ